MIRRRMNIARKGLIRCYISRRRVLTGTDTVLKVIDALSGPAQNRFLRRIIEIIAPNKFVQFLNYVFPCRMREVRGIKESVITRSAKRVGKRRLVDLGMPE